MNPFTWVFFALLSMDALRELLGLPSVSGCGERT
ncbi:KPN_01571 family protein [Klebsiella aerogenes]